VLPEAEALEQNTRLYGVAAAKQSRAMGIWAHQTGGVMKANTLYARSVYFKVSSLIDSSDGHETGTVPSRFHAI